MRSLQSLLTQLGSDVGSKLDVVSGRRPRILRDGEFRDVDEAIATEDDVLDLCRLAGGARELENLGTRPVAFVVDGPRGRVRVTVVLRGRDVVAAFVPIGANEDGTAERAPQPQPKRVTALRSNSRSMRRPSGLSASARASGDRPDPRAAETRRDSRSESPGPRQRTEGNDARRGAPAPEARREDRASVERAPTVERAPAVETAVRAEPRKADPAAAPPTSPSPEPAAPIELDAGPARIEVSAAAPAAAAAPVPAPAIAATAAKVDVWLREILVAAKRKGASDVHLSAGHPPSLRVCGTIRAGSQVATSADIERALRSMLPARSTDAYEKQGSACFGVTIGDGIRVRVNATATSLGPKLAMRLVHAAPPSLEELGLPSDLEKSLDHPQGLVLIVGPSGHGKTTTLACLVDALNRSRAAHIVTIEEPVEIPIPSAKSIVSQREVGAHTRSVEHALAGVLRLDPDVIAVGELDGAATTRLALAASGAGQLVLATMNAPSGPSAIERLIDAFSPEEKPSVRALLAATLRLVLCQRLVPTSDGMERAVAIELLLGVPQLSSLIQADKLTELPSLIQRGRGLGFIRMEDSVAELVSQGKISGETARALVSETEAATEIARRDIARLDEPALEGKSPVMSLGDDDDLFGGLLQKAGAMFGRKGGS